MQERTITLILIFAVLSYDKVFKRVNWLQNKEILKFLSYSQSTVDFENLSYDNDGQT